MDTPVDGIKVLDAIGIKTANFTAATTDIITSAAHGLVNGNKVVLTTTDTLPAGLSTGTVYYVIDVTTNTFKLSTQRGGGPVDITDTGTGTHTFTMHDVGDAVLAAGYKHIRMSIDSDGGGDAEMTVKFQGSNQITKPDFSAAQAEDNQWDYVEVVDLQSGTPINGDDGIAFSGADDHRNIEYNVNGMRWVNVIISGWVEGELTVICSLSN